MRLEPSVHINWSQKASTGEKPMPIVWGTVEAVTIGTESSPRIIVWTPGLQRTIDVKVGQNTVIARGIEPVPLTDIKRGEFVELCYTEVQDTSEACMVYLRVR